MAQQYGTVKVDFITFTSGTTGTETDVTIPVSGLSQFAEGGDVVLGGNLLNAASLQHPIFEAATQACLL